MNGLTPEFVLVTIVSLFTIVNPIGATPLFLAHTGNLSTAESRAMAKRASMASCAVLLFFALTGGVVFKIMGVTIPAFRIAGGILVFISALDMLKGANVRSRTLPEEQREALHKEDISIIPLAIPLLSGPGAISTVIVLMARHKGFVFDSVVVVAILVVSALTYLILANAGWLLKWLGASGVRVMNRLMGLVLAGISVQFVINGLKDLLPEFARLMGVG